MEVIINHPYTEAWHWQGHLPRNFLPANLAFLSSRKSPGICSYLLSTNISSLFLNQHGFRAEVELTTDIAMGFNQRSPQIERSAWLRIYRLRSIQEQPVIKDQQISATSGHGAMALLLSKMQTSHDLFQRCKVNVYKCKHRHPARLQTFTIAVQLLHC